MPKQDFTSMDLMGVLAVWVIFFIIIGIMSVTCINFCCIHQHDDVTKLEEWGHRKRLGVRLGVHRRSIIAEHCSHAEFKRDK